MHGKMGSEYMGKKYYKGSGYTGENGQRKCWNGNRENVKGRTEGRKEGRWTTKEKCVR